MAFVIVPCPRCGADARTSFGQSLAFHDGLAWFRSVHCPGCGFAEEADYPGALPDELRARLLREHGLWELVVPRAKDRMLVAAVAREALALDLRAALQLARAVPGVVRSGTEREMAWLGLVLARRGVVSLTRPVVAAPVAP